MEKNYQSTGLEILLKLKEFVQFGLGITGILTVSPYIIPTSIRFMKEVSATYDPTSTTYDPTTSETTAQDVGGLLGLFIGAFVDVAQLHAYSQMVNNGYPEVLAIPIATNAASGIYELIRLRYKRA